MLPFAFQKHSPLLKLFNYYAIRMKENSGESRFNNHYKPLPQFCPDYTGKPLGFESMISGFLVIIVGVIGRLTILMLECLLKLIITKNNEPRNEQPINQGINQVTNQEIAHVQTE